MSEIILITGSEGLIGAALCARLSDAGLGVRRFDLRQQQDVNDPEAIHAAVADCSGIVHLAAVSRVIWGEQAPERCWQTNVEGTRNVLGAAISSSRKPWVIVASSREVYGHVAELPATEDAPLRPCNVYGRSKVETERLCMEARGVGLRTAILRFSNVYGNTHDHADRVVPCFARLAVCAEPLRVDGRDNTFDFTHLDDTVLGIMATIEKLRTRAEALPPIHLLTGQPTTLGELAQQARGLGGGRSRIIDAPPRSFDVSRFYGNPQRAQQLLGWCPRISISDGLRRLVRDFAEESLAPSGIETAQRMRGAAFR